MGKRRRNGDVDAEKGNQRKRRRETGIIKGKRSEKSRFERRSTRDFQGIGPVKPGRRFFFFLSREPLNKERLTQFVYFNKRRGGKEKRKMKKERIGKGKKVGNRVEEKRRKKEEREIKKSPLENDDVNSPNVDRFFVERRKTVDGEGEKSGKSVKIDQIST